MRVVWTPEAQQDRADVWDYIAADNPRAAARMDEIFSDAAARLIQHPMLGKPGKIPGTRELIPHESYRLVYQIDGETVWILTLVHTARLWPPVRDYDMIMATMKRRVDRLLSSQTAVGGRRPVADGQASSR